MAAEKRAEDSSSANANIYNMARKLTYQELLEAGVHFGHLTRKVESEDGRIYIHGK
ncbi:MAG: hypothetical protein KatS3mg032_2509 [Cyclobacteriaceae bacterium]|nr:MAG: hypothetical protein KatS3mg032_2509 [Cyclobacteriaceae bacterium]